MRGIRYPQKVKGKIVGYYWPTDAIYEKVVDYEKHHSYKMGGWGIQAELVHRLKRNGCEHVVMHVTHEGSRFKLFTWFQNYILYGEEMTLSYADGPQIFLRDEYWKTK